MGLLTHVFDVIEQNVKIASPCVNHGSLSRQLTGNPLKENKKKPIDLEIREPEAPKYYDKY